MSNNRLARFEFDEENLQIRVNSLLESYQFATSIGFKEAVLQQFSQSINAIEILIERLAEK